MGRGRGSSQRGGASPAWQVAPGVSPPPNPTATPPPPQPLAPPKQPLLPPSESRLELPPPPPPPAPPRPPAPPPSTLPPSTLPQPPRVVPVPGNRVPGEAGSAAVPRPGPSGPGHVPVPGPVSAGLRPAGLVTGARGVPAPAGAQSLRGLFGAGQGGGPITPMHGGARFVESGGAELWLPDATAPAVRSIPPAPPARPGPARVPLAPPPASGGVAAAFALAGRARRSPRRGLRRGLATIPIPTAGAASDPGPAVGPAAGPIGEGGRDAVVAPVGEGEGAAFAARFVAEFLSWDEDDPTRRAQVLRTLLRDPRGTTLGWAGAGRQRVELVLPGRTLRTECGGLIVEVTARVLSFHRVCPRPDILASATDADPATMSCCPPPSAAGWAAGDSSWTRLAPPVVRLATGELKVDLALQPTASPREESPGRHGGTQQ